ncbi:hypothetical protein D3C72_1848700 [compost metagenome]
MLGPKRRASETAVDQPLIAGHDATYRAPQRIVSGRHAKVAIAAGKDLIRGIARVGASQLDRIAATAEEFGSLQGSNAKRGTEH